MKTDISKNELSIRTFRRAVKSYLPERRVPHDTGRHWDGLIYILGGECEYRFDDGLFLTAREGDLLYLAKDSLYQMEITSPLYRFIFADFLFEGDAPRQSAVFRPGEREETENLFYRLLTRYNAGGTGTQTDCLSLLYRVYSGILRTQTAYLAAGARSKAEEARAKIPERCVDPGFSVTLLAKEAGMSDVWFRKLFRARFGVSPAKDITDARIRRAKDLLRCPDIPLEEVAAQSGFSSVSYFCRTFGSHTGMTPGQFRKKELE